MLKKSLKKSAFFIICFLMIPVTGLTLGLGNITVFSKLNEPLKVQIELINPGTIQLDDIHVKNAHRNDYKRANLPRPAAFHKVRFKVKKISNGLTIVELTSNRPVREPFITFIADLRWRKGHMIREYTFLLDPPELIQKQMHRHVVSPKKQADTRSERTSKTNLKSSSRKTPRVATHKKINYSTVIASHTDGDTYKTKRADTLWNIAKKVKPGKVTTYQTMQALYALNPDAFINNNIDLLKQGQTLKVPTQSEILQINGKAPLTQSSEKNKSTAISSLTKQQAKPETQKKNDSNNSKSVEKKAASIETSSNNEAQLKIIPTNEVLLNTPVTSKNDLVLINRALKNSISTIKALQNENDELNTKINRLTDELANLSSHNTNLDDRISEVSVQLKDEKQELVQQADEVKTSTTTSNLPESSPQPQTSERKILEVHSAIKPTGDQSRSFIRELITSPVIAFALAIFTIIILVATLIALRGQNEKRKQKNENPFVPYPADHDKTQRLFSESGVTSKDPTKEFAPTTLQGTDIRDDKDEDDMDFFEYFEKKINTPDDAKAAPEKATEKTVANSPELSPELSFELEIDESEIEAYEKSLAKPTDINNTLSEIDTYIAYGNYNEAEKSLVGALKQSPTNMNLHLKLFECYTYSNKRYEFINHAEKNINLLNTDMVLRHRIENIFQKTWNEPLTLN